MSVRRKPRGSAGWKHWDLAALLAGGVPLIVLLLFHAEAAPAEINILLLSGALVVFGLGAIFSWRQGDARLAAAGGLLLILALAIASPMILLLFACLMGNCI